MDIGRYLYVTRVDFLTQIEYISLDVRVQGKGRVSGHQVQKTSLFVWWTNKK
jgi:hypothetical protein